MNIPKYKTMINKNNEINHPSGDYTPSQQDIDCTNRIKEAGKLIGVTVLDHIIVAANNYSYYSFMERGI